MTQSAASVLLASVFSGALTPSVDVLWKPDGTGDVRTWAEVMTLVRGVKKPVTIFVQAGSGTYSIPVGTYEMHGSEFVQFALGAFAEIECADGVVFRNLGTVTGCGLRVRPTTGPAFEFDPPAGGPAILRTGFNGLIANEGTVPALEISGGGSVVFANQGVGMAPSSTAPLIHCADDTTFALIAIYTTTQIELPSALVITGTPAIPLIVLHAGAAPEFPHFSGWGGAGVLNNPTTVSGGSGPTANRPVAAVGPVAVGCMYFDTDLGEPVWWDGVAWLTTGGGGGVTGVTGTAPITSTGGATPDIGITPATITDAGSMSAADKAKLDAITIDGVTVTAPITSTGGPTPDIGITAATITDAGSMSAADKAKLDSLLLSGNTAGRPVAAPTGTMYFDTDLGLPVWWTGAAWVSAAGLVA